MGEAIKCWAIVQIDTNEPWDVRLNERAAAVACQRLNGYGIHEYEVRPATLTVAARGEG